MNHFASLAQQWDTPKTVERNQIFSRALMKYAPDRPKLSILDFGCGTGLLGLEFIEKAERLVGLDTTAEMLDVFRQRFQEFKQAETLCVNLEENSEALQGQFDFIYTAMAFHHLKAPLEVLKLLKEHLKPDGKVAVIDLDQEDGTFHPDNVGMGVHHYGFGAEELQSWALQLKFSQFQHEIIHSIDKNERFYRVALSVFSL